MPIRSAISAKADCLTKLLLTRDKDPSSKCLSFKNKAFPITQFRTESPKNSRRSLCSALKERLRHGAAQKLFVLERITDSFF